MDFFERIKSKRKEEQSKDFVDFLNRRNAYMRTFGSDSGREVLLDQMQSSHMFKTSFTGNSQTFYAEGERGKLLDIMMHAPLIAGEVIYMYCKQLEENIERRALELRRELEEQKR